MESTTIAAGTTDEGSKIMTVNATDLPSNKFSFDGGDALYWLTVITFFISVFLVFVGILGNIFIIATIRSKRYQFSSHGIHLTALAVADIQSLLVALVNKRFVWNMFGTDIRGETASSCRTVIVATRVAKLGSISFVALVCVERFIAVWFPLRAKLLTTRRTSYATIIIMFAFAYVFSIVSAFFSVVKNGKCVPNVSEEDDESGSGALTVVFLLISSIVPTMVLVFLTPLTLIRLSWQRSQRKMLGHISGIDDSYRTTIMLISICVAYLLLVTSFSGTIWIFNLSGYNVFASQDHWAVMFIEITVTCENLNCALNFILYGFFSLRFRRDFFTIMKCKRRSNVIGPSS